jgi:sugar lactone lactonase YvrE
MRFGPDGTLFVADAGKGLLSLSAGGELTLLATSAGGRAIRLADDLDVARDGTVYFSDASVHPVSRHLFDLLEGRPHGRLLHFDPATGRTTVLLEGLAFANGVALASDESFVLVAESYRYRITRYWLKGPRQASADVFAENLPGFPDGISSNRRGTFWVAFFTARNALVDRLQPRPFLKRVLSVLPAALWPKPEPYGLVVAFDERGQALRSLHDPTGRVVRETSAAHEHERHLYLGTLYGGELRRVRIEDDPVGADFGPGASECPTTSLPGSPCSVRPARP